MSGQPKLLLTECISFNSQPPSVCSNPLSQRSTLKTEAAVSQIVRTTRRHIPHYSQPYVIRLKNPTCSVRPTALHRVLSRCWHSVQPTTLHRVLSRCWHSVQPTALYRVLSTCWHSVQPTALHSGITRMCCGFRGPFEHLHISNLTFMSTSFAARCTTICLCHKQQRTDRLSAVCRIVINNSAVSRVSLTTQFAAQSKVMVRGFER
jgi:hypothetical protein